MGARDGTAAAVVVAVGDEAVASVAALTAAAGGAGAGDVATEARGAGRTGAETVGGCSLAGFGTGTLGMGGGAGAGSGAAPQALLAVNTYASTSAVHRCLSCCLSSRPPRCAYRPRTSPAPARVHHALQPPRRTRLPLTQSVKGPTAAPLPPLPPAACVAVSSSC
jgi:hypothetical protein